MSMSMSMLQDWPPTILKGESVSSSGLLVLAPIKCQFAQKRCDIGSYHDCCVASSKPVAVFFEKSRIDASGTVSRDQDEFLQ